MAFTQQTFLGASIAGFDTSIGWKNNPSQLTIKLVEDPANGDSFINPDPGTPYIFSYDGWEFGGIVQSKARRADQGTDSTITVILQDPRDVLDGTELILGGYSGTTNNMPNLLNVYGYWEDKDGFGGANLNDGGMPWEKVKDGVTALTKGESPSYGGLIALSGHQYRVDLSLLPSLPSSYRVNSSNISLMTFVREICDAANHEFFFRYLTITETINRGNPLLIPPQIVTHNVLKLITINRNVPPVFGAIDNFIATVEGATSKNIGQEFRNEVTSKFLTGGNQSAILFQDLQASDDQGDLSRVGDQEVTSSTPDDVDGDLATEPEKTTIWPFWGFNSNRELVIAEQHFEISGGEAEYELVDLHKFDIDARWIREWPYDNYPSNIGEMRAAKEGFDPWVTYLNIFNWNYFDRSKVRTFDPAVDKKDDFRDFSTRNPDWTGRDPVQEQWLPKRFNGATRKYDYRLASPADSSKNPHFGKMSIMESVAISNAAVLLWIAGRTTAQLRNAKPSDFAGLSNQTVGRNSLGQRDGDKETALHRLYEHVKKYADEYLGRKFMVRIPATQIASESETGKTILSQEPESDGFLNEDVWDDAVANNLLPPDINSISTSNGRIIAFARYDDITDCDLSDLTEEEVLFSADNKTAFIKVEVDEGVVYQDATNFTSPRAVVTLPGVVAHASAETKSRNLTGIVGNVLVEEFQRDGRPGGKLTEAQAIEAVRKIMAKIGSDTNLLAMAGLPKLPNLIAIPLKSNVLVYGPWVSIGANGKMEYEQDESLVPWNYGGYTAMNNAANARVSSALSNYQISENGSVEVPGAPTIDLGSALIASGPYVTRINVSIGSNGVKTSYGMNTWTPEPYKITKIQSDFATKIAKANQLERRNLRERSKSLPKKFPVKQAQPVIKSGKSKRGTSHDILAGEVFPDGSGGYNAIVAQQPQYNFSSQLETDYVNKAGATLDSILYPYATNLTTESGIPKFVQNPTGSSPTVADLNPWGSGHSVPIAVRGDELPESLIFDQSPVVETGIRAVGFKLPMIGIGYGYDSDGNPVPAGSGPGGFVDDVRKRSDQWKVGPIDFRWSEDRGVWEAGGAGTPDGSGNDNAILKVIGGPSGVGSFIYSAERYTPSFDHPSVGSGVVLTVAETGILVGNFRTNAIVLDKYYHASKIDNVWILDNEAAFLEFV